MNDFKWWWLSFADEEKGCLGVTIVFARDLIDAVRIANELKISPGGEVLGYPLNAGMEKKVCLFDVLRLLSTKEAQKLADYIDE